jgi:phosphoserine phosphatase
MTANGLRANEGRETKALNCKPITNLKEKFELSNYCKTSGFRLHAVSGSFYCQTKTVSSKFAQTFHKVYL